MTGATGRGRPNFPDFRPGEVWLVGAGPGDPGLLTLLAAHALAKADIVVHDALVGAGVLALARPEAEIVHAGKRGGKPSARQPDITKRIIELARAGRRVLRLKGGDPFVFGRGGEEAMALAAAGIRFRIVPGITAGIGGLAAAGIPATHRTTNGALVLITGHEAGADRPEEVIDWRALAAMPALALYMALGNLGQIAARLIACGRARDEPVALIEKATLPGQRVVVTTLASAARDAAAAGIEPPVVVAIGANVALRAAILPGDSS
jgi:uroporphyrin-III C-methyltransferase